MHKMSNVGKKVERNC